MNLARFAAGEFYQDDPSKRGFVSVEYHGNIIRAYPSNETMWLSIPSREWVDKYGDSVWALIERVEDDPRYWCWKGIAILAPPVIDDPAFDEWLADFPYVRMYFTENWKYIFNDTEGRNTCRIVHEDGTVVLIDRTEGSETIKILDGINEHEILLDPDRIRVTHGKTGATITLDADGNVSIVSPEDVTINSEAKTIVNARSNVEVSTDGDAKVNARGKITLDAGQDLAGLITGRSIDPFTRTFHIDSSRSVEATK